MSPQLRAIFLAAGQGSRMGPYTSARPKCLLPIEGVSLLERLVAVAHQCDVTETIVVRGKKGGAVRCPSVVYIDDADGQNMVHSLFKGRDYIRGRVIITYADILKGPAWLGHSQKRRRNSRLF